MAIAGEYDFERLTVLHSGYRTLSVNIFKWIYKWDRKGLKKSKGVYRVKGPAYMFPAINERARQICDELNAGKNSVIGKKKSETIK
jgi:hypothetical protein